MVGLEQTVNSEPPRAMPHPASQPAHLVRLLHSLQIVRREVGGGGGCRLCGWGQVQVGRVLRTRSGQTACIRTARSGQLARIQAP